MTTLKLRALGRIGYDIIDARIAGKSAKVSRREASRRVRHNLKRELRALADDDLESLEHAVRDTSLIVAQMLRDSGIGVNCVLIRDGKVVVP